MFDERLATDTGERFNVQPLKVFAVIYIYIFIYFFDIAILASFTIVFTGILSIFFFIQWEACETFPTF